MIIQPPERRTITALGAEAESLSVEERLKRIFALSEEEPICAVASNIPEPEWNEAAYYYVKIRGLSSD